jgi:AraC family transcriptional regulator
MTKAADLYAGRMERVTRHIESALRDGQTPTVEELAAVAAWSPFHFHRIYRILSGEPIGQTLRRLRLSDALARTHAGDTITEAAHGAGFDSSQSLARAAQRQAGASVSELRASGRLAAEAGRLASAQGNHAMAIEIVDHAPITLPAG